MTQALFGLALFVFVFGPGIAYGVYAAVNGIGIFDTDAQDEACAAWAARERENGCNA